MPPKHAHPILFAALAAAAAVLARPAAKALAQTGFFSFGPCTKGNETAAAGYRPDMDLTHLGGIAQIGTRDDTPNLWIGRLETTWSDNTTVGRLGAQALKLVNGQPAFLYDNGSDGEIANVAYRLHIDGNGTILATAFSMVDLNVVADNDPNKVPFTALRASGQNGGQVILTKRNANGTFTERVL